MSESINLPYSEELEKFIIGKMINSRDAVNICVESLQPTDFFLSLHQDIFVGISLIYSRESVVEITPLYTLLKQSNDKIKLDYLMDLSNLGWGSTDVDASIDLLKDLSNKRILIHLAREVMTDSAKKDSEAFTVYSEFQSKADPIFNSKSKTNYYELKNILSGKDSELGMSFLEWVEKRQQMRLEGKSMIGGYETTYPILDDALDGLNKGHFIIVAARPGVGKTTFIVNLIHKLSYKSKLSIGFFSLEMSKEEFSVKIATIGAGISLKKVKGGYTVDRDYPDMYAAVKMFEECKILVDDQAGLGQSPLFTS